MPCVFCDIAAGRAPCHKVWEDAHHLAFLGRFPNTDGMTVVITKDHHDSYFADLPASVRAGLADAAATVARKIDAAFPDVGRVRGQPYPRQVVSAARHSPKRESAGVAAHQKQ
jgi:diadenosine tetraphosphate (Ap4A) HIT family hydrolase